MIISAQETFFAVAFFMTIIVVCINTSKQTGTAVSGFMSIVVIVIHIRQKIRDCYALPYVRLHHNYSFLQKSRSAFSYLFSTCVHNGLLYRKIPVCCSHLFFIINHSFYYSHGFCVFCN